MKTLGNGHIWALKLTATVPVVVLLMMGARGDGGVLAETRALGPWAVPVVVAFFALVILYCRDLERVLAAIPAAAQVATPRSVWWMLVLPLNFVEDFFIVHNISRSLDNAGRGHLAARASGFSWCAFQIVSLLPGRLGEFASVVAVPFRIHHWWAMRRAIRILSGRSRT